jgi:hypothetical protein
MKTNWGAGTKGGVDAEGRAAMLSNARAWAGIVPSASALDSPVSMTDSAWTRPRGT